MKELILIRPKYFYILVIPFILMGLYILLFYTKSEFFLLLNPFNTPIADTFFMYITWLGNGLIFFLICFFLAFKSKRNAILGLTVFIVSAILPQILKNLIFPTALRPVKYFENTAQLHLVEGVKHHMYHSFPSGHSTSAFALALFLTLIVKDKRWGILFASMAIITAYSRVYLAQHFFEDIYAGALLGIFSTVLVFASMEKWLMSKTNLNKGLI